ncbi:hypothetical protein KY348_02565 [Candidatus Woesearchaeota archaeon]|nr:hypothetical protein [Candidatus Woesearchaeota archaeon]
MAARLIIEIPKEVDPVAALIRDERRFIHALSQFADLAWPNIREEDIVRAIGLAAGEVSNQYLLYQFFVPYMPDEKAKSLLEDVIEKMGVLYESTFGKTLDEMKPLGKEREKYCRVLDGIMASYSALTDYLKSKTAD